MEVSLDDLIARARLESGLRSNAYYDNDQIVRYLDAGGAELADLFTAANQHYVIKEHDFSTTGPDDAVVPLPLDFQQGHSLEVYPGVAGQTRTIKFLPNWLNRNAFVGAAFPLSPGGYYPVYTFLGDELRFYPPQAVPAAPWRLYYTPQWTKLLQAQTASWDIGPGASMTDHSRFIDVAPGDSVQDATKTWVFANGDFDANDIGIIFTIADVGGPIGGGSFTVESVLSPTTITTVESPGGSGTFDPGATSLSIADVSKFSFPNAAFTDEMAGGEITITFTDGLNDGANGTYAIYDVLSPTFIEIRNPTFLALINPTAGTIAVTWQPTGTRSTLPGVMGPWSEYLVVYAAIAINIDRQRGTGELERKLQALKGRVASIISQRQEEPQQPPLTRGMGGGWDGSWGGGGGWQ